MEEKYRFSESALKRVSEKTREFMIIFANQLPLSESIAKNYQIDTNTNINNVNKNILDSIQNSARLVYAMAWAKTSYYKRGVITSINDGNLLVSAQCLRAMVELSAMLRMTAVQVTPIVEKSAERGHFSMDEAHELMRHMSLLLHGGRFDWETYFLKGPLAAMDSNAKMSSKNMLSVGNCIKHWSRTDKSVGFIYDFLCDLVHPNKGSNLLMLEADGDVTRFGLEGTGSAGWLIFDQIFGFAAKLGQDGLANHTLLFATIGKIDTDYPHELLN